MCNINDKLHRNCADDIGMSKIMLLWLARDAMLARYMLSLCVCPSVCLSQVGVLPQPLNVGLRKQRRTVAYGTLLFWHQRPSWNSNGVIPQRGRQIRWS